jgi:hypothetical protein
LRFLKYLASIGIALSIAACGGGDESASTPTPVISSNGTGTFKENTRLMAEADLVGANLTGTTLTVRKPQATVHTVGSVLVVDGFGGRLIRITGVTQSNTEIVYTYELASLAQAFDTLDVKFSGELTPADLGDTFNTDDPEVEISWREAPSLRAQAANGDDPAVQIATNTLEIKYKKMGAQVGSGIEIDGSSSFAMNPDFSIALTKPAGAAQHDLEIAATINPALQTSLSIHSLYGGQVSYTLEKSFKLKPFKRIIIVPVMGVPVPVPFWIQPVIGLSGGVNGTAGSKFSTTYGYGVSGSLGFNRKGAAGFEGVASLTETSDMDVTDVESTFGVNLGAPKLEIQFLVYSVAGPNFEMGFESGVEGSATTKGTPAVEGVEVKGSVKLKAAAGLKGGLDFSDINAVKALLGDVSFSYTPFSLTLLDKTLYENAWWFPYTGQASVKVYDNGSSPDDIFEISLDGVVLGRTNKGGSGQFRLKDLRPGNHTLSLVTVEDDDPPGTYAISLADGLTLLNSWGYSSTSTSGTATLGQRVDFTITVPAAK